MRLQIGPPPAASDFEPLKDGWTALREPTPLMLQLVAAPIAIGLAVALYFAWTRLTPLAAGSLSLTVESSSSDSPGRELSPLGAIVRIGGGFFLLIVVHEVLHAVAMPGWGITRGTLIGVWPSRMLFYAAHLGPLSKSRFIVVFLMPLLVLTIVPLVISSVLHVANSLVAITSIVNGACACGDLVGVAMIAWQVPRTAQVRNQGWQTWWRSDGSPGATGTC